MLLRNRARRRAWTVYTAIMAKDRQWLKQRLCTALGWDQVVVEGVVEAIASAESAEEVDALVQVINTFVFTTRALIRVLMPFLITALPPGLYGGRSPA